MPSAAPFIAPALGIAGSLIGGRASSRAARQQERGQQAAIETQKQFLSPFAEAGTAGLGAVQEFVGQGADFSQTQAFKDITNLAKAGRGAGFGSGNLLTDLSSYYATNFRPQRLNELAFLPQLGARAAGDLAAGIGGLQQNIGDIRGAGTLGRAGAFASGLGALGSINFLDLVKDRKETSGTFQSGMGPFGGG